MRIGREIAEYIAHTEFSDIPTDVAEIAKHCFMDWLGVTLAGARSELAPVVSDYLSSYGNDGPATLLGSGRMYDIINATFGNGVYSHALDFDDYHMATVLHTTPPTLPALLAAAEYAGSSSKELLTALVLALDATLRLGKGVKRVHYDRGWHITSTIGRFGAVAGVSKLMGLSKDVIIDAIDLMVEIRNQERPSVSDVEKIEIEIDRLPLDAAGIREPKTLHEARFSIYFIAALALREGRITVDNFTEDKVMDPVLVSLRKKVQAKGMPNAALSSKVRMFMKGGKVYERYTPAPKGSTESPITFEALKDKFKTTSGLSPEAAARVIEKIMHMEKLSSIKEILSLL